MGKRYDQEYKDYVVKLVVDEGRKMTDVAYELDIRTSTLANWVSKHKREKEMARQPASYITPSELETLKKEHLKEIEKIKEENEILKKAMHIFTQNQE